MQTFFKQSTFCADIRRLIHSPTRYAIKNQTKIQIQTVWSPIKKTIQIINCTKSIMAWLYTWAPKKMCFDSDMPRPTEKCTQILFIVRFRLLIRLGMLFRCRCRLEWRKKQQYQYGFISIRAIWDETIDKHVCLSSKQKRTNKENDWTSILLDVRIYIMCTVNNLEANKKMLTIRLRRVARFMVWYSERHNFPPTSSLLSIFFFLFFRTYLRSDFEAFETNAIHRCSFTLEFILVLKSAEKH